jgi:hypothetical protein
VAAGLHNLPAKDRSLNQHPAPRPMNSTTREARLRPEFAELYPPLAPDVWEPAAELGAKMLLWQVQQHGPGALVQRTLEETHFEFRGGWTRGSETAYRTRALDTTYVGPAGPRISSSQDRAVG